MQERYIYKSSDGKLILPTFVYEICAHFNLTGNRKASDFAVMVVTKIAGKADILNDNNVEFNSETIRYYESLYNLIQKEGGLEACETLSDYTKGNDKKEIINQLVESGIIKKEKAEIDSNGEILLSSSDNSENVKWAAIKDLYILRNSEKYLILPDEIYAEYNNFDGDDAYSFAKKLMKITTDAIPDNLINIFNFYATIFKLVEKEGRCVILSDFCKKQDNSNKKDFLEQMINSKHAYLSLIEVDNKGRIKELRQDGTIGLESSIYLSNDKHENDEFYSFIDTQTTNIEKELKDITDKLQNLTIQTYKELMLDIKNIKSETYSFYKKALKMTNSYKDLMEFAETAFNKLMKKIEFEEKNLIKEYNNQKKVKEEELNIDYFEQIKKAIDEVDAEVTQIDENMHVSSEKDYMSYNSKLTALRDKLYEIFDASLQSAYDDGSLTLSIVKEASTKHNESVKHVNETIEKLENMKNKISFNNIFNT